MGVSDHAGIVHIVKRVRVWKQTVQEKNIASFRLNRCEFVTFTDMSTAGVVIRGVEAFWMLVKELANTCETVRSEYASDKDSPLMPSSHKNVPPPRGKMSVKQWTMVKATLLESRNCLNQSLSMCQEGLSWGGSSVACFVRASLPKLQMN